MINKETRMIFTKLATTVLAGITAFGFAATAVAANPVTGSFESHEQLWSSIQSVGVRTYLNPVQCGERDVDGFYMSTGPVLVICQDNGVPGGPQVDWTDNDLDTLRHEAQHLVQDCLDGQIGDNRLIPLFNTTEELSEFLVNAGMTDDTIERIIRVYASKGADRDIVIKELEAFATARSVDASTIAQVVVNQCSVK